MRTLPYTISLEAAPSSFGENNLPFHFSDQSLFITASFIKSRMRSHLKEIIAAYEINNEMEDHLFGFLTYNKARASLFQISAAIASPEVHSYLNEIQKSRGASEKLVPKPLHFQGSLVLHTPDNTADSIAIITSLLAIRNLSRKNASGISNCKILLDASDIDLEELYKIDNTTDHNMRIATEWLPHIRMSLLRYYALHTEKMRQMQPCSFERFVAEIFRQEGFEVELTPASKDGGYDIIAVRHQTLTGRHVYLVECKRYDHGHKVDVKIVRGLMGVVQMENATKGIIVTTASFTKPAQDIAVKNSTRLALQDYNAIRKWLISLT